MGFVSIATGSVRFSGVVRKCVRYQFEEGKIRRVGGSSEITVDARVIAASNRDLQQLARDGEFREDLYHRLNLLHVRIPPLRERKADIMPLVEHLGRRLASRYQIDDYRVSELGKKQILNHEWPGNMRELAHEVERSIILGDPENAEFSSIGPGAGGQSIETGEGADDWLNPGWEFPEDGIDLEAAIDRLIDCAIDSVGGNVTKAARKLRVQRDYIRYRKKKREERD